MRWLLLSSLILMGCTRSTYYDHPKVSYSFEKEEFYTHKCNNGAYHPSLSKPYRGKTNILYQPKHNRWFALEYYDNHYSNVTVIFCPKCGIRLPVMRKVWDDTDWTKQDK